MDKLVTPRIVLLLACIVSSTALFGQYTITSQDHYPSIGDSFYNTSFANLSDPLDVTHGGANQVWDFSSLTTGGDQLLYTYSQPSAGMLPADYPNAEWVEQGLGYANGVLQESESYYSTGPGGNMSEGTYIDDFMQVTYGSPRMWMPFPMDYGDVVTDPWTADAENFTNGQQLTRVGETVFEYDGYGTLILPHITLNDVVRVKAIAEYDDDSNGMLISYSDTIITWFSNDYNHYVASYTDGGSTNFPLTYRVASFIRDVDEIYEIPVLEMAVSADSVCAGDCFTITNLTESSLIDEATNVSWSWSFPGGTPATSSVEDPGEVCYNTPGVYDITLQLDVDSLSFSKTFPNAVTVIEACGPIASFNYTPIVCYGQCYSFESTSENATQYFWTFEGAATPTSEEQNPTDICYLNSTGTFNVTLTVLNDAGSSTSITQQIKVVPPTNINAGPDQTITQGTSTTLSVTGGAPTGQYIWQPFEQVVCFSCPTTQTIPLNETNTFVVYYEPSGGCQASDTVTVFVEESFGFGIPNSFSPNDDGINDVLYVRGSNISSVNLIIYNRYGQEVFQTNNQREGWDGTRNGRPLTAGVFGYHLEVTHSDGSRKSVKGDVSLVR